MICGDDEARQYFPYRSSSRLTEFFEDCDLEYVHYGSTRWRWVSDRLKEVLALPQQSPQLPPDPFLRIIQTLLDTREAQTGDEDRANALAAVNTVLKQEGWEAFYDEDSVARLRHIKTKTSAQPINPHRPLSSEEITRRKHLSDYLDRCSEDELIEGVLLPLFRNLGFRRITAAGHKDKALEYGKDIWMKYTLPTGHVLYFGIQVKKGKLDSSGVSKSGNANVAEIHNQVSMMLGHEIFDQDLNRKVLVDHAFIVAGGEITKQAMNWLGAQLDAPKRSQILFMDRGDILDLFVTTNVSLPAGAHPEQSDEDEELPF